MLPKFLNVEFDAVIASTRFNFFEEIIVDNFIYKLSAIVRNDIGHFSCAVLSDDKWNYFDDLLSSKKIYNNLSELIANIDGKWFFGVYKKDYGIDFAITDRVARAENENSFIDL